MLSVNTNPAAFVAVRHFGSASRSSEAVGVRLSTGLRVAGALDDASNFSIAQGIRGEIRGWQAVSQGLGSAAGAVRVALTGATGISDLLGELKKKVVEYFATDADRQPIIQNDIDALLDHIDLMANGAAFNGLNLINADQPSLAFTPPPDQGTTFTFNGPGSNSHALGTTAGMVQVNFTASGSGGGQFRLIYDGSVVANTAVNPPTASGSLSFVYGATGPTSFTVQKTGSPNVDLDYAFTLTPTGQSGIEGDYKVLKDVRGGSVDIQFRSLLAADIGLRPPLLTDVVLALGQVEAAELEVNQALGYYGAKHREIVQSRDMAERFLDAQDEGLGNIVDADIARDAARLTAFQVREYLALGSVAQVSRATSVILNLFA